MRGRLRNDDEDNKSFLWRSEDETPEKKSVQ